MNKYLMSVERYFSGTETFEIEAENISDAIEKAKMHPIIKNSNGNVREDTLKVVKKLRR